jgi:hypothetical protein
MNEPKLHIGIMYQPEIIFRLNERYLLAPNGVPFEAIQKVEYKDGRIWLNGEPTDEEELLFEPVRYSKAS